MTHSGQVKLKPAASFSHSVRASPKRKVQLQLWTVNCVTCNLLLSSLARFVNWGRQSCQLRCHWAKSSASSASVSSTARYQTIFIHKSQSHSVVNSLGTRAGRVIKKPFRNIEIFVNFLRKYLCNVYFCAIISYAKYSRKHFQIFPRFMQRGEDCSILLALYTIIIVYSG